MTITLIYDGCLSRVLLPESMVGRYWFFYKAHDGKNAKLICVEGCDDSWNIISNTKAQIIGDGNAVCRSQAIEIGQVYRVRNTENKKYGIIFATEEKPEDFRFCNYSIPDKERIYIGRGPECDIIYHNSLNLVSTPHAYIQRDGRRWTLVDNSSTNGTYVNGHMVRGEQRITYGDTVFVMGLVIIIGVDYVCINNPEGALQVSEKLSVVKTPLVDNEPFNDYFQEEIQRDEFFYISPRINKKVIKEADITVAAPPQKQAESQQSLILTIGPAITMGLACAGSGIFSAISAINSGNISSAIPTLLVCFSMLVGTILWPIISRMSGKKEKGKYEKKREARYTKYLSDRAAEIDAIRNAQMQTLRTNIIPVEECLKRAENRSKMLWERLGGHDDFLTVRLGVGNMKMIGQISYPSKGTDMNDDELLDKMYDLCQKKYELNKIPISLSLFEHRFVGAYGSREDIIPFSAGIIAQLAALHSYNSLKFAFIIDEQYADAFSFARWLPHTWNESRTIRYFAANDTESKEVSMALLKEFEFRNNPVNNAADGPHFVIFCMGRSLFDRNDAVKYFLKTKTISGVSAFFMAIDEGRDDRSGLPEQCETLIKLDGPRSKLIRDKSVITDSEQIFSPDIYIHEEDAARFSKALANIITQSSGDIAQLPSKVTFLQMYDVGKVEHLNIWQRWESSNPVLSLSAPLGVDASGSLVELDIHQDFQGSHGLIGGTTGSGKSEFVKTYMLSLAVNYSPNYVSFIIIDYKGGGLADSFVDLPHTKGIITNLDGTAVERSLASIRSEVERRQVIMRRVGMQVHDPSLDIYSYHKLQKSGQVEPLPHLLIICDEFAELKDDKPDFMDELVSVARTGRSAGVHLVLCTQSPGSAISPEIWKNSMFHISLQVDKNESMEILKCTDGANLPHKGSFYLHVGMQAGNSGNMSLGQSAWSGAIYSPANHAVREKDNGVVAISNTGKAIVAVKPPEKRSQLNGKKQIQAVIEHVTHVADEHGIKSTPLWLAPIPSFISIDETRKKYNHVPQPFILNPVIGEYDDPEHQSQSVLTLPITTDGNVALFGVTGSGRSAFISTLIYSLMSDHSPKELSIYLVDMSSEALGIYRDAPQIGDIIFAEEEEKITNLFSMIRNEIPRRRKILSSYGGDYKTYVETGNTDLPNIVLVINNYPAFNDLYKAQSELLIQLAKDCIKYGIYIVISATNGMSVRSILLSSIKQRFAFQMNDDGEYRDVLGLRTTIVPASEIGRGLVRLENSVYEFQTARFVNSNIAERDFIMEFVDRQCAEYGSGGERRIKVLPYRVKKEHVVSAIEKNNPSIPIGVGKKKLVPVRFDFSRSMSNLVLSQAVAPGCFTAELAKVIAMAGFRVVYLDAVGDIGRNNVTGCEYASDVSLIKSTISEVESHCRERSNSVAQAQRKAEAIPKFERVFVMVHSMSMLMRKLESSEELTNFKNMLQFAKLESNVTVIIDDSIDGFKRYRDEQWSKNALNMSDGIWIGSGLTGYGSVFTLSVITDSREAAAFDDNFGYAVVNGVPTPLKALTINNGDDYN